MAGSKQCTICKLTKPVFEFYIRKTGKPYSNCIACDKIRKAQDRTARPAYYRAREQAWRLANSEILKVKQKQAYQANREYYLNKCRARRLAKPESYRRYNNNYVASRCKTDPLFCAKKKIRSLITASIKCLGFRKNTKTEVLLGCSFMEFKQHIERQFEPGMTWDNHGSWHIDHKIPMCTASTESQAVQLNHYTNLQPLWAADNLSKSGQDRKFSVKLINSADKRRMPQL